VRPLSHSPCRCERAVRIMTIRALHESFVYPVLEGHGELRLNGRVAGVTQTGFWMRQQRCVRRGVMDGMTGGAAYTGHGVLRMTNSGPAKIGSVAGQAALRKLLHRVRRWRKDGPFGRFLNMVAGGAVTAFASGSRFMMDGPASEMGIAGELLADIRMASLADVATNIRSSGGADARGKEQHEDSHDAVPGHGCPFEASSRIALPSLSRKGARRDASAGNVQEASRDCAPRHPAR